VQGTSHQTNCTHIHPRDEIHRHNQFSFTCMTTAFVSSISSMLDPGNEFNQVSVELGDGITVGNSNIMPLLRTKLPLFTNLALENVWTIWFQIGRLIWIQDNSLDFSSSNNKKIGWTDLLVKGIISKELLRMCQVNSVLVIWFRRTRTIVTSLSQWTWSIMNVSSVCSAHCILTDAWYPCGLAHTHLMSFVGYVLAWTWCLISVRENCTQNAWWCLPPHRKNIRAPVRL
jgi:hypothetical protein